MRRPSPAMVVACLALAIALGGASYAAVTLPRNSVGSKQVKNNSLKLADLTTAAKLDLRKPRGYARIRVVGIIPSTSYWDMKLVGPRRGFASARTPFGGITCLKPKPGVLTTTDVLGGVLQDASGNDTRLYFNGNFSCSADEVRVVQKSNFSDAADEPGVQHHRAVSRRPYG